MAWDDKRPLEHFKKMTAEEWSLVEGDLGYVGLADYIAYLKKSAERRLLTMNEKDLREIEARNDFSSVTAPTLEAEIASYGRAVADRGKLLRELKEQIKS